MQNIRITTTELQALLAQGESVASVVFYPGNRVEREEVRIGLVSYVDGMPIRANRHAGCKPQEVCIMNGSGSEVVDLATGDRRPHDKAALVPPQFSAEDWKMVKAALMSVAADSEDRNHKEQASTFRRLWQAIQHQEDVAAKHAPVTSLTWD